MTLPTILPFIAAALAAAFIGYTIFDKREQKKHMWVFPALVSLIFLTFSITAVVTEGSTGFWVEHTRNLWGNQIWFDLLLAACIGWFLIVPQARKQGMSLILWAVLVLSTGSIGFTAMVARLWYLKEKSGNL